MQRHIYIHIIHNIYVKLIIFLYVFLIYFQHVIKNELLTKKCYSVKLIK